MSNAASEWWDDAACAGLWDLFFGPDNEYRFHHEAREAKAKAICADCPVQSPCAESGAAQRWGVWGGAGEAERTVTRRSLTNADFAGVVVTTVRLAGVVARLEAGIKHCNRCDADKPLEAFGKASRKADGLTAWCRDCTNAYMRDRTALATDSEMTTLMNTLTLDWRDRAACRSVSADLFFTPDDRESPAARQMREQGARTVCGSCPVTAMCLDWATSTGDQWSISGGLTPEERGRRTPQQYSNARRAEEAARRRAAVEAAGKKRCTGPCGKDRPLSEFTIAGHRLRGDCKSCRNAKARREREEAAS